MSMTNLKTEEPVEPTLARSQPEPALSDTLARASGASANDEASASMGSVRYERGRELGRGGMGRVVEAVDRQFSRVVALKELLGNGDRARFATEALVTGNLEHPGIPSVYERGVDERGLPFYAMRKVRGRTLAALLADARSLEDRLGLLPALLKTAQTLGYAHEHGVIHRDVKPENVIVGTYGDVVLLDWGIARVRGIASSDSAGGERGVTAPQQAGATVFGSIMGTPAYMSPEQASGDTDAIDERTDVFALGALLYHLLTGRAPYQGTTVDALLGQARDGTPPEASQLERESPASLVGICQRAMAKRPAERFRNATELARALEEFESKAFLGKPGSKLISVAVSAVTVLATVAAVGISVVTVATVPSFKEIGYASLPLVVMAVLGTALSGFEWVTRGRYALSSMALGFAVATFCAGVAGFAQGLGMVSGAAKKVAADPELYRELVAQGLWECVGGLTLGAVLTGAQFLVWGIARRRANLQERSPQSAATSKTLSQGHSQRRN